MPESHANSQLVRLSDTSRPVDVEFTGEVIARTSTERPELLRWTEMELYRITEGERTGAYVFQVVGRSLVYHHERNACGKGVLCLARDLPGFGKDPDDYDAEPCAQCSPRPLDVLPAEASVLMEEDWRRVGVCDTARDVHLGLAQHASRSREPLAPGRLPELNYPARRLLEQAALRDPAFVVERTVERL